MIGRDGVEMMGERPNNPWQIAPLLFILGIHAFKANKTGCLDKVRMKLLIEIRLSPPLCNDHVQAR